MKHPALVKSLSAKRKLLFKFLKDSFWGWGIIAVVVFFVFTEVDGPYNEYLLMYKGKTIRGFVYGITKGYADDEREGPIEYDIYEYVFTLQDGKKIYSSTVGLLLDENDLLNPYAIDIVYLMNNPNINKYKGNVCKSFGELFRRKLLIPFLIASFGGWLIWISFINYLKVRENYNTQ